MKFHALHLSWLICNHGEHALVVGIAGGRVPYDPEALWLYSIRIMLLVIKVEVLWQAGGPQPEIHDQKHWDAVVKGYFQ